MEKEHPGASLWVWMSGSYTYWLDGKSFSPPLWNAMVKCRETKTRMPKFTCAVLSLAQRPGANYFTSTWVVPSCEKRETLIGPTS